MTNLRRASFALAFLAMSLTAFAQVGRSGLMGTAVDEKGQPVADVEITLSPAGESATRAQIVKTDKRGRFQNRFLTSGRYLLGVKDAAKYFIQSANVQVKDPGGVLLNQYDMINDPKKGMESIPIQNAQVTELRLVITTAATRQNLIRGIESSAMSGEISQVFELVNQGKNEEALTLGQEVLKKTTTEIPQLLHALGVANSRLGKYAEAEPLLKRAAELAPDQTDIPASLGTMYLAVARAKARENADAKTAFADAATWLAKAMAASQPSAALTTNYAIALEGAGRIDDALATLDQISKADPNNVAVRLRMASLLRKNGKTEQALQVLNGLPGGSDPRAADGLYNVALDFYNAEDYESALAALKRAEELKPDHALVQRLMGRVYYVASDYPNAVKHLKRFLELDPNHAEADQDRELVAYMEKVLKK